MWIPFYSKSEGAFTFTQKLIEIIIANEYKSSEILSSVNQIENNLLYLKELELNDVE